MSKQEDALRKKIKKHFDKRVLWIEPTRGSTVGLPDCLLAFPGMLVPAELKFEDEPLRPAQERFVELMRTHSTLTLIIRYWPKRGLKYNVVRMGRSNHISEWYENLHQVEGHISLLTAR